MRNEIDNDMAMIRSEADLKSYLQSAPISRTPLGKLSLSAQRQFLASLTFNEKGLTGFNYRALPDELSVSEIYQVLSLFGMQRTTAMIPDARIETSVDAAIMRHISPQACPPRGPKIQGSEVSPQFGCDGDRKEYRCESKGTCQSRNTYICTSNC
jgi:hypothetical protein